MSLRLLLILLIPIKVVICADGEIPGRARIPLEEVCEYAKEYCSRARNHNSLNTSMKRNNLLRLTFYLKDDIDKAANMFNVPPDAIASVIVAENSMNVNIFDEVQEINSGIKTSIKKSNGSIGLGQMNEISRNVAEEYLAKAEKREVRSRSVVLDDYRSSKRAVYFIAAYLQYIIETYSKLAETDISKDTPILATLYNLGTITTKAREHKRRKDANPEVKPRINYFGWYVDYYLKDVQKVLNIRSPKEGKESKIVYTLESKNLLKSPRCNRFPEYGEKQVFFDDSSVARDLWRLSKILTNKEEYNPIRKVENYNYNELLDLFYPLNDNQKFEGTKKFWTKNTVVGCDKEIYHLVTDGHNDYYVKDDDLLKKEFEIQRIKEVDVYEQLSKSCSDKINSFSNNNYRKLGNKIVFNYKNIQSSNRGLVDQLSYTSNCEISPEVRRNKKIQYVNNREEFNEGFLSLSNTCQARLSWGKYSVSKKFASFYLKIKSQITDDISVPKISLNKLKELSQHCLSLQSDPCVSLSSQKSCSSLNDKLNILQDTFELEEGNVCGVRKVIWDNQLSTLIDSLEQSLWSRGCSFSLLKNFVFIKELDSTGCFSQFKVSNKHLAVMLSTEGINFIEDFENRSSNEFSATLKID